MAILNVASPFIVAIKMVPIATIGDRHCRQWRPPMAKMAIGCAIGDNKCIAVGGNRSPLTTKNGAFGANGENHSSSWPFYLIFFCAFRKQFQDQAGKPRPFSGISTSWLFKWVWLCCLNMTDQNLYLMQKSAILPRFLTTFLWIGLYLWSWTVEHETPSY